MARRDRPVRRWGGGRPYRRAGSGAGGFATPAVTSGMPVAAVGAGSGLFSGALAFPCAMRLTTADSSGGGCTAGLCVPEFLAVETLTNRRARLQRLDAYVGREQLPNMVDARIAPRKLNQYHRHRSLRSRMCHPGHLSLRITESLKLLGNQLGTPFYGDTPNYHL